MKKTIMALGALLVLAGSAFAQGPFADVPTDHWAYDAVNELQQAGIVIGYPDGTFGGKRAMSRYEFAVATARAIPVLVERIKAEIGAPTTVTTPPANMATKEDIAALQNQIRALEAKIPDVSKFVTQDQFKALQSLVNEFRDELAALGVDVDALKRDVAGLSARVAALEKESQRVKWTGSANLFAQGTHVSSGAPIDRDDRPFQGVGAAAGDIINSISFVRDMDLGIQGSLTPGITAVADINFGNYLSSDGYLGGIITDYTRTIRPNTNTSDQFIPYYLYAQAGLGKGSLSVGRIPVQYTPYTLKLIDPDSYTYNPKTDSGNYPLDGGMATYRLGGVTLTGFAAKTNQNSLLGAGLVSQPTSGLYAPGIGGTFYTAPVATPTGHAAGGLAFINQAAGARALIGTPFSGTLGLTYVQAAGPFTGLGYDTVNVYGADFNAQIASFPIALNAAQTRTTGEGVATIDDNSTALDGKLGVGFGKLGIDLGYRDIGNNFGAPGYWTKLGRWTNPTNVRGPYANLTYGILPSLNLVANGEFYKGRKALPTLPGVINDKDDKVWRAEGGLKWGFTSTNSVNLGIEYIRWNPSGAGVPDTKEQYINIGLGHQINPSAGFNIGYQIVDYKPGAGATVATTPYGPARYKGGIAVAQVNARF